MKLDVIVNRTHLPHQYLRIRVFLGKDELYYDIFAEGRAKVGRAAVMMLTSDEAVLKFPGTELAGSWADEPISIEPFGVNVSSTCVDITTDIFMALYKNGYREALMSMVDQLSDPSNEILSRIVKLLKEGRYRDANSYMAKLPWNPSYSFYMEFGKVMELLNNNTEGIQ